MDFRLWLENDEEYEIFGDPKEWHVGQIAILDETGFNDFAVVKIVRFEDPPKAAPDEFTMKDNNTVIKYNPYGSMTYKRGESVPIYVFRAFGPYAKNILESYRYVGAQNLYRTIDALIKKNKHVYPDLFIRFWNSPQYAQFIKEFPQLKEKQSFLDQIEYHPFDVHGYTVLILGDPSAMKKAAENKAYGYPHPWHVYYFTIPELNIRSQNMQWLQNRGFDHSNGLFTTIKDALAAAEKYIDYLFYSAD